MSWVIEQGERFYLHDNETLLGGLIRTKKTTNFECCQGYCGTCKVRIAIKNGDIAYTMPPLCHLDDDEVLACCCLVSGTIEILT